MNNIDPIMKVRNADYLEWQIKIQQLEEENKILKSKLASIKYLDRATIFSEICKIYDSWGDNKYLRTDIVLRELATAICNLALLEVKTLDRQEVLILYDDFIEKVFNNFKEEILEGYQSFKINQEYQIISDNFINAICKQ